MAEPLPPSPKVPPTAHRHTPSQEAASPKQAIGLVLGAVALLVGAVVLYQVLDPRDFEEVRSARPQTLALSELRYDAATRVITGVVRNRTEVPYDRVTVSFDLLDSARAVVGAIRDSVAVVEAGGAWNFRIPVPTPGVTRVRLVGYAATRRNGDRSDVNILQDV